MYAYDFEYDGLLLSDFGFMVCDFNGGSGAENAGAGSEISFNLVPVYNGKRFSKVSSKYEKCLSTTFQICKNPELYDDNELIITPAEYHAISRWLNRNEFLWFHSLDNCDGTPARPWHRASFNLSKIEVGKDNVGIELSMQTDSPFGYAPEEVVTLSFTSGSLSKTFTDKNDEIGDTYPEMTITCGQSGTLTLSNNKTGCSTEIKGCVNGEVITLSGDTMIVSSSVASHDIANDFNYDFYRFANTYASKTNTITANRPCTVVMRYRPIVKDTL